MAINTAPKTAPVREANFKKADRFINISVLNAAGEKRSIGRITLHEDGKSAEQSVLKHLDGPKNVGLNTSENYDAKEAAKLMKRFVARLVFDYKDGVAVEEEYSF